MHVDGLVLDGLERPDRDAELLALLGVLEHQVEDPLARAHGVYRQTGERDVTGPLPVDRQPRRVGQVHVDERHVGDVQHRVEDRHDTGALVQVDCVAVGHRLCIPFGLVVECQGLALPLYDIGKSI